MTEQARLRCPRCGNTDSTVNLRAWRAEMDARIAEAREAHARQAAKPVTRPPAAGGSASAGVDPPLVAAEEVLVGIAGLGLAWAWRKMIWDPFKKRAGPAMARYQEEAQRNFSSALDRHPELWLCPRDEVVFRASGGNTVPARDAMRWLREGDDVKLMAALGQT